MNFSIQGTLGQPARAATPPRGSGRKKVSQSAVSVEVAFDHSHHVIGSYLNLKDMMMLNFVSTTCNSAAIYTAEQIMTDKNRSIDSTETLLKQVACIDANIFLEKNNFETVNDYHDHSSLEHVIPNGELSNEEKQLIISGLFLLGFDINNIAKSMEDNWTRDYYKRVIVERLFEIDLKLVEKALAIAESIDSEGIRYSLKRYIAQKLFEIDLKFVEKALVIFQSLPDDWKINFERDIAEEIAEKLVTIDESLVDACLEFVQFIQDGRVYNKFRDRLLPRATTVLQSNKSSSAVS